MKSANTPTASVGFLLSKIGAVATERMAGRLSKHGLRPRHAEMLSTIYAIPSASQEELSRALGLVPSAVVKMIDDLESIKAVARVADPDNRRRYSIELTRKGKSKKANIRRLFRSWCTRPEEFRVRWRA